MPPKPAPAPAPEVPEGSGTMPEYAVEPVTGLLHAVEFLPPVKAGDQTDHLLPAQAGLRGELIIPHAGISSSCTDNAVQDIFAVIPPVKGEVIFF